MTREILDRNAGQRWETEGGSLAGPSIDANVAIRNQIEETAMWMRASMIVVSAGIAAMVVGCSPAPSAVAAAINDRVYTVTPDAMKVRAGIVSGEVTEMKITERVEEGTGRIASAAKLTGKLVLKNVSTDQTVRLLGGKIVYIDVQDRPIKLEDSRAEPTIKVSSSYGASDRLDPGQETAQDVDAEFPVDALKAKKLKDIRFELSYIPSAYKEEALNFPVSIGGQQ